MVTKGLGSDPSPRCTVSCRMKAKIFGVRFWSIRYLPSPPPQMSYINLVVSMVPGIQTEALSLGPSRLRVFTPLRGGSHAFQCLQTLAYGLRGCSHAFSGLRTQNFGFQEVFMPSRSLNPGSNFHGFSCPRSPYSGSFNPDRSSSLDRRLVPSTAPSPVPSLVPYILPCLVAFSFFGWPWFGMEMLFKASVIFSELLGGYIWTDWRCRFLPGTTV